MCIRDSSGVVPEGVWPDALLAKAQSLIDVACPVVVLVGVQNDTGKALFLSLIHI